MPLSYPDSLKITLMIELSVVFGAPFFSQAVATAALESFWLLIDYFKAVATAALE